MKSVYRTVLMIFIVFIIFPMISCASQPILRKNMLQDGSWSYAEAELNESVSKAGNKTFKKLNQPLNSLYLIFPDGEGVLWLKKDFEISSFSPNNHYSLLAGKITMADETYLNGILIGKTGQFPPEFFSEWNRYRLYSVPSSLLQQGNNELLIKIYVNGEGGISGKTMLQETSIVRPVYISEKYINVTLNMIIAFIIIIFAVYHLWMFILRPSDIENFYFSILSLSFAFYESNFFITHLPGFETPGFSYLDYQKFVFIMLFLVILSMTSFIKEFLKNKIHFLWMIPVYLSFSTASIMILTAGSYQSFNQLRGIAQLIAIVYPAGIAVFFIIHSIFKKSKEAFIILLGFSPILLASLFDIITHQVLNLYDMIYISGFGFPLFLIATLFILAGRFISYRNEADNLSKNLELKVQSRTKELSGLISSVKETTGKVFNLISGVSENLSSTAKSSQEIKNSSDTVLSSTQAQSRSLESGFQDIQTIQSEMNKIMSITDNYKNAFESLYNTIQERIAFIQDLESKSKALTNQIVSLSDSISNGTNSLHDMQESVDSIHKSINEIIKISNVIKDISSQTNVLSLNAGIEATNAGQFGKGFAVVAKEIKKLAEDTNQNVESTDRIIHSVQDKTKNTIRAVDGTINELEGVLKEFITLKDFYGNIDQMLKDEFHSKNQLSSTIANLKNEINDLAGSLNRQMEKINTTTQSFNEIKNHAEEIDGHSQTQAENIHSLSESLERINDSMQETRSSMESLQNLMNNIETD